MKKTLTILALLSSCWCQAAEYTFSSTGGEHGWWDADAWTLDGAPATWENGDSTTVPENTARIQSDTTQTITVDHDVYLQGIDIVGTSGGDGTTLQGTGAGEVIHLGTGSVDLHATSGNRFLKFKDVELNILDGATTTWNLAPSYGNWLVFEGSAQVTGSGTWVLNFGASGYNLTLADTNGANQVNASGFTGELLLQRGSVTINQTFGGALNVAAGTTTTINIGASGSLTNTLTVGDNATALLNFNASGSFAGTIRRGTNAVVQLIGTISGSNLSLPERGDFTNGNANLTLESGAENAIRSITTTSAASGYILMNSQSENPTQYIDFILNNNNNNQGDLILTEAFIGKEAHIGNLSGNAANAQVRVDWGGNTEGEAARTLVVHQTEDAAYAGKFTSHSYRTSALTKTGSATLTLEGASTTSGLLRVAEGRVNLTGSWAGTAQVDDDATLAVTGSLGSGSAENGYAVAERGKLTVAGSGSLANRSATISALAASRETNGGADAVLKNVTMTTEGIARTSSAGRGSIENGRIGITQTGDFSISDIALTNTLVQLQAAGSLNLSNVVLSGGSAIINTEGGVVTMSGANALTLSSGSAEPSGALTYTPAGSGSAITFAGLSTSQLSGVTLASGATLTLDVANSLLCSEALVGQQYLAITFEGLTGFDNASLTGDNFLLDSHLTDGFAVGQSAPEILGVETVNGGTVVYVSFSPAIMPEPATASLGLLGLAGLMLRRRRKQA